MDRTTIDSDRNGSIDYYEADLTAATSCYSYGAVARSFNADSIRYAFNGQRRSFEISNTAQTALYWEYDGDVGRRWNLDPKPTLGVSPYNCFGGNPVWRSDVLGDKPEAEINKNNKFSPIYDQLGNFLGTDNRGFTGDVILMSSANYFQLKAMSGNQPISHTSALKFGSTLGGKIDEIGNSPGGKVVHQEVGLINKVINDVVSRTPNISGFEPRKLVNGSISSVYDNRASTDEFRIYGEANGGETKFSAFANTIENKVTFNLEGWGDNESFNRKLKPTVENLQNTYTHEAGGHLFHKWGDETKTHSKVIGLQMHQSTWKGTTDIFKQTLTDLYNDYRKKE